MSNTNLNSILGLLNINNLEDFNGWASHQQILTSDELKNLVGEDIQKISYENVITSYYTPKDLIKVIWQKVLEMGFGGGKVLEPSCGNGRFFKYMPQTLNSSVDLIGVEIDKIAADMAKALNPTATIYNADFKDVSLPYGYFDLVIGNVPFGKYKLPYKALNLSVHNYFIAKSLDLVREGGLVCLITSPYTLDSETSSFRKYLREKVELIKAVRLPYKTFNDTEVCADILFLKKTNNPNCSCDWIDATDFYYSSSQWGTDNFYGAITVNKYWKLELVGRSYDKYKKYTIPHNILGTPTVNKLYGHGLGVINNGDYLSRLQEIELPTIFNTPTPKNSEVIIIPSELQSLKLNAFTVYNNSVYQRDGEVLRPSQIKKEKVEDFKNLYNLTKDVIEAQKHLNDSDLSSLQAILKNAYMNFKDKYGEINSKTNLTELGEDPDYYLVRTLEKTNNRTKVIGLADIFTKRVIKQYQPSAKSKTAEDTVINSLNTKGKLDYDYMAGLLGISKDALLKELQDKEIVYLNPINGEYEHKDIYLSGNVYQKLQEALKHELSVNISALRKVQPLPMLPQSISDELKFKCLAELGIDWECLSEESQVRVLSKKIECKIGAHWIPQQIYKEFVRECLHSWELNNISYISSPVSTWYVTPKKSSDFQEFGTSELSSFEILEKVLNGQDIRVNIYVDKVKDDEASMIATEEARAKAQLIKQAWAGWLWTKEERVLTLTRIYNTTINVYAPRRYSGEWLELPGLNPQIKLRPWQLNAVARIIFEKGTFLAHDVGLGKTLVMICGIMELRRLGLVHKPLLVALNGTERQIYEEFKRAYPLANVLLCSGLGSKEAKKLFTASIKTGDFDCVILTHSQFFQLGLSKEYQVQFLEQEKELLLEFLRDKEFQNPHSLGGKIIKKRLEVVEGNIFEAKNPELNNMVVTYKDSPVNKGKKLTRKQKEEIKKGKTLDSLNLRVLESKRKYDHIDFEDLTDCLVIDEIHQFKNLAVTTKLVNIKGIPTAYSQRATDTYTKILYTLDNLILNTVKDRVTKTGRVIGATGTIFSNTLAEIYNWQRFFQLPALKELELSDFDAWVSEFAEAISSAEITPEGAYKVRTRLKRFSNLSVLHALMSQFVDIVTFDMVGAKGGREFGLIRPEGIYIDVIAPPSESQLLFLKKALVRAERIRNKDVKPGEDNFLKLTTDLTKAALSMRLLGDEKESIESKLHDVAFNVWQVWQHTHEFKGTQLVFCDFSTPKNLVKTTSKIKNLLLNNGVTKEVFTLFNERINNLISALSDVKDLDEITKDFSWEGDSINDLFNDLDLQDKGYVFTQILNLVQQSRKVVYNVYQYVKNLLLALGIPEQDIEFIHDHNDSKRSKLFDRVNSGEVRILLGSTSKLGTGCNVHKNGLWALHHIDAPWRPSDIEQREGRGIRQLNGENLGKTLNSVLVFRYITERLDALRWQTLQWKQEATKSFLNGADIDSLEDTDEIAYSYAQVKSLATGNPMLIEETNLQNELNSLLIQERSHKQQQLTLQSEINRLTNRVKELLHSIDGVEADIKLTSEYERLSRVVTEEEEQLQEKIKKVNDEIDKYNMQLPMYKDEERVSELISKSLEKAKAELKELKTKLKEFETEDEKLKKDKLKSENENLSGKFAELNKDGGVMTGSTRQAGVYRGLRVFGTNIGASLNFSVVGNASYAFPFKMSQQRFLNINRQTPINSIDKFIDFLPTYLTNLNEELNKVRQEQTRAINLQGKEFGQIARINEIQSRLIEIREIMSEQEDVLTSNTGEGLSGEENNQKDGEGENNEFWLLEDESGQDLSIPLNLINELKSRETPYWVNEVIEPQLEELRVIRLSKELTEAAAQNNMLKIARIYKACANFPEHWQTALKSLSLSSKKVVIGTLAKLNAIKAAA